MTNENALKEILRGEPVLSEDAIQAITENSLSIGPQLLVLLRNIRLWHTEDAGRGAVLHAIRLIGGLQVKNAIPALVDSIFLAYSTRHEEALEDLPVALAQTGESAIGQLASILEDQALDATIRSVAASGLEGIGVLNPETRNKVLEILRKIISEPKDFSSVKGHVITIVAHFREPDDRALIKTVARSVPMLLDMDADEIDEYFRENTDPEAWGIYKGSLLDYYR